MTLTLLYPLLLTLATTHFTSYDTGQIADILLMEDFLDRFAQTNSAGEKEFSVVREGLVVGLLSIGTLFGAIVGRYFSDYLGRRKAIAIFCGMFSVGVLIQGEYSTLRAGFP